MIYKQSAGDTASRQGHGLWPLVLLLLFSVLAGGCASSKNYAPTTSRESATGWRPDYHVVKKGDTLYSIAWKYGYDYRDLGRRNGIGPPYTIYVGQRIHLKAPQPARKVAPRKPSGTAGATSKTWQSRTPVKRPTSVQAPRTGKSKAQTKRPQTAAAGWVWPTKGKVISTFSNGDPLRKGVEIAGRNGQPVIAAAPGKVVYSGSGLRGYGMLIIVKHDDNFLSAYAHNRKLLVKEGEEVKVAQRIAEMGKSGTDRVKLHFEIRHDGKPVDPLRYLPRGGP